jgi:hypothetical protein
MGALLYLGGMSLLDAFPIVVAAKAQISALSGAVLPDLQSRLAGAISLSAKLSVKPPSLSASIQLATTALAQMRVAIVPPQVNFAVSAVAALITRLQGIIAAFNLALQFGSLPGTVRVYVYTGRMGDMGATVTSVIAASNGNGIPLTAEVLAPIIVVETSDTVATASLRAVVRT